jgi:hypothetical protein
MGANMATLEIGQMVATPGALRALAEAEQTPLDFLVRHLNGDWGEISPEDWEETTCLSGRAFGCSRPIA